MKKRLAIILVCVAMVVSLTCVSATCEEVNGQSGFTIEFNGEVTDCVSVIYNDTHHVPMRKIFEKMGAYVFYRNSDRQILALSRDGDMIRHIIGDNTLTINGKQKMFENTSVAENGETYIPIDMVAAVFCPDRIWYEDQCLKIQKQFFENEYHKIIKDVLDVCKTGGFYAEKFPRYLSYHIKAPAYTIQEVVFRVNLGLDYPFYENMATIENPYDVMVLVNKYNRLPENFEQTNLVAMAREYTNGAQHYLSAPAYEKYVQMADAARADGVFMHVVSSYRTEGYQRSLYNNRVSTTGKTNADNYSARPGSSEHQTGLAVDISSTRGTFQYTPEFRWLQAHAHEYGYILRYPLGKEWITGYSYEPWHYRYVGTDVAKIIYEEGITYEEYYAKYISVNEFK